MFRHRLLTEPVVLCGNHEPLIFRRRTGNAAAWEAERFAYEHSEDLVKKLAARGTTWVRTHFFKGYGLEAEREEIEMTRAFTELCHAHGIKVELYTQWGTLQYETFLTEAPEMLDWCAVNEDGRHTSITYGHQDFRYKPCVTREGYWSYLKKVLEVGIKHVKADAFGFDNVGHPSEPESCHCDECRRAFREYLKAKYRVDTPAGRARATERFGFAALDHVEPPRFNRWNPMVIYRVLKNPVMQEWLEFKCDAVARRFEETWRFIKGLKRDMVVEYNVLGDFGCNNAWYGGTDIHRLLPWADAFWNERAPNYPGWSPGKPFHHRVHPLKLGQAYDAVVFDWHAGKTAEERKLSLAEGLAFNQGHVSGFGYMVDFANGSFPEADDVIAFRRANGALFDGARSAAQVGLVEHARSLNYDCVQTQYSQVLAFASLLAAHQPFNLVPEILAADLKRHDAIVLANAKFLSDAEAKTVLDYVRSGGTAVVTDETGLYDDWARRRREGALAGMLKGERGEFGKGRFVYIPRLEPVTPFVDVPSEWEIDPDKWHLPKNFKAFADAVRWALGGRARVEVSGPTGLVAEANAMKDGRLIVHLLNYNLRSPARNASVTVRGHVTAATLCSPWAKPKTLRLRKTRDGFVVPVGTVARYAILELRVPVGTP